MALLLYSLRRAILDENVDLIQQFLQELITRNRETVINKTVMGVTPLSVAVGTGNAKIVEIILSFGADVNKESECYDAEEGETEHPIIGAVRAGPSHIEVVQVLINYGANLNVSDSIHCSPLIFACLNRCKNLVKILLENGAKPDYIMDGSQNPTALFFAVRQGDPDITRLLLEHGANPNITNYHSATPLHVSTNTSVEAAKIMIKFHADLNLENDVLQNSFLATLVKGEYHLAALLLQNGAQVSLNKIAAESIQSIFRSSDYEGAYVLLPLLLKNGLELDAFELSKEDLGKFDSILYYSKGPLMSKCRKVIRAALLQKSCGASIEEITITLPIPDILKMFLLYGI